jgi:hypothetical protein
MHRTVSPVHYKLVIKLPFFRKELFLIFSLELITPPWYKMCSSGRMQADTHDTELHSSLPLLGCLMYILQKNGLVKYVILNSKYAGFKDTLLIKYIYKYTLLSFTIKRIYFILNSLCFFYKLRNFRPEMLLTNLTYRNEILQSHYTRSFT